MIEFYEDINAEIVNQSEIVLNPTDKRVEDFEILSVLTIVPFCIILVLNYNQQNGIEFLFSVTLLISIVLLYKFRKKIFYKKVVFDRTTKMLHLTSSLARTKRVFYFSEIFMLRKKSIFNKKYYHYFYIEEIETGKQYYLIKTTKNYHFVKLINEYLYSRNVIIKDLIDYEKE